MGFFDFNDAPQQQNGELLPAKTLVKVVSLLNPGGEGEGGYLTIAESKFEYLNFAFTITSSPQAGRKIFQNVGIGGVTDGHAKAAEISRSLIRAMLESARGIDPKDASDKANSARRIQGWKDLDQLEFAIEVGIEKGKGGYEDRNNIRRVLTVDHPQYAMVMAGNTIVPDKSRAAVSSVAAASPVWAQTQPAQMSPPPNQAIPATQSAIPAWAR